MNPKKKLTKEQQKMARVLECMLLFLAFFYLTGCGSVLPVPQEMGNMALLRTFAIDKEEEWQLTVSTGKQVKGLQGNQEPPTILQGEGFTIQGACSQVDSMSEDYVFYGYIDQLLLGEPLSQQGILPVLEHFARSSQLSLGTGIWMTQGKASTVVEANQEEGTEERLSILIEESQLGVAGITRKVGQVLTDLKEEGATYLPLVSIDTEGILQEVGYGIVKEDKSIGVLQGDSARGLELLEGQAQLMELETEEGNFAFELSQIKVQGTLMEVLQTAILEVTLQVDILEYQGRLTPEQETEVLHKLEHHLEQLCNDTIAQLQLLHCDPLALHRTIGVANPWMWNQLENQWNTLFPTMDITVQVEAKLGEVAKI